MHKGRIVHKLSIHIPAIMVYSTTEAAVQDWKIVANILHRMSQYLLFHLLQTHWKKEPPEYISVLLKVEVPCVQTILFTWHV